MNCPKCRSKAVRVPITNNMLSDQVLRRRLCADCGHRWFTVETAVPDYAVGWSAAHRSKPVLRVPVTVEAGHTQLRVSHVEAGDQLAGLRAHSAARSAAADAQHRVTDCD